MIERPCIRCQHPLSLDGGQLVYCSVCGAPQIFLSEELQEQTALEVQRYSERASAQAGPAAIDDEDAGALSPSEKRSLRRKHRASAGPWPLAVQYALLSSGIALGLDLLGLLFAPVLLFAWLWAVGAPILTIGFYNTRTRPGRLTAGFAARLGLLTGLLIAAACALAFTLNLLLSRFVFKNGVVDTAIAAAVSQLRTTAQAQPGNTAAPMLHLLGIPEFRVGFLLWVGAFTAGMYLLVSVATAGVAGLLLGRRRAA